MAILSCHVSIKLPPKISDGQFFSPESSWVYLPVHQVARAGDIRRPVYPGPLGIGMVEGIVIRPALDDLIERDGCRVVAVGASSKDRIVFDVGPGFEVTGRGQPAPLVSALVEEIPRAVLEPGRRGAVRAGTDRRPVGLADVERAMIGPVHTVSRTQPVRDIVLREALTK